MDYRYNNVSYDSTYYNYHDELLNSQLLASYEDSLIPVLVPPEEDLVPILVPPEPTLVPPGPTPRTSRRQPQEPEIHIIEVPVEVYIEVPVEVPNQQTQINQIPQYILNGYIESLVTKKELCPILMNELTLDSTCITPCNHAMSKEALDSWFETNESCPVCRTQFTMSQVQCWKN
jgi:hypothetical protein